MNEPKLKGHTIVLMVCVALFYDILQLLLYWLMIPVFYLTYYIWFKMHGINFLTMKRAPIQASGAALEIISAGLIPAFTFIVLRVALDYKIKEISSGKVTNLMDYKNKRNAQAGTTDDTNQKTA